MSMSTIHVYTLHNITFNTLTTYFYRSYIIHKSSLRKNERHFQSMISLDIELEIEVSSSGVLEKRYQHKLIVISSNYMYTNKTESSFFLKLQFSKMLLIENILHVGHEPRLNINIHSTRAFSIGLPLVLYVLDSLSHNFSLERRTINDKWKINNKQVTETVKIGFS